MDANKVYKKIEKFAIEAVTYNFFMNKLRESRSDNPINCWYTTEEGNKISIRGPVRYPKNSSHIWRRV